MNDVDYLNARRRNPVKNEIVWMRHYFSQVRYPLARFVEVGMFCSLLQIVFYPIEKTFCGLLAMLTDEVQNFQ